MNISFAQHSPEGVALNASGGEGDNVEDVHFDRVMGLWLPGTVAVLGVMGNSLSLLVLSRDRSRSATFESLKALAVADLVLLVGALLQQVIPMYCITHHSASAFCRAQGHVRVYSWPIICAAQMTSIWVTVLVSAERYVAICWPLRTARLCTQTRVRGAIALIYALALAFNLPKFFEFVPEEQVRLIDGRNLTFIVVGEPWIRRNLVYRYLYNMALYFLATYAFPMGTLTVLNVRLVRELRRARRHWDLLNRSRRRELQASVLPLVIVGVYFVCGTQSLLAFILDALFVTFYGWLQRYTAVVNFLVILNSAINFVIMYLFGRKFRRMLFQMLTCSSSTPNKGTRVSTRSFSVTR